MRILALNIGNTTLLGAVFSGARISRRFRVPTLEGAEGLAGAVLHCLGKRPVDRVVVCSVVPDLTALLCRVLRQLTGVAPIILSADAPHGLQIAYRQPGRLGTDRLAATLGARILLPRSHVLILDCGTASTVTALHRDGRLCGGAILPGLGLWSEALSSRTAQLPAVQAKPPGRATGLSPEEAIASGLYHGHLGALERLCREISAECFGKTRFEVLATGGNARIFRREKLFTRIEPDLILTGLLAFGSISQHDA